jgi:hypothetical protein
VPKKVKTTNYIGFLWGLIGVSIVFFYALSRLIPHSLDVFDYNLNFGQWLALVGWGVFMILTEGYSGFQKNYAPRFAERALSLTRNPKNIDLILAPLFCMGFFNAPKKRLLVTWSFTLGIIFMIIIVGHINQPWRGIIDIGVSLGLIYGLATIYYFAIRYFRNL